VEYRAAPLALDGQMSDNTAWISGAALDLMNPVVNKELDSPDYLDSLVRRALAGDPKALESIYERFKKPVFRLVRRYAQDNAAAEDLLQDIFIKIFSHLQNVKDTKTFTAWVYRIAINACYSYLREKKGYSRKTVPLAEIEGRMEGATHNSHEGDLKKPIDEAIQSLPRKLRSVFLLHDVQGFKHEEIAKTLGCSVGTSKSQLFKARLKIRLYLKNKGILSRSEDHEMH
jgi:RNA polymerase sigma-70 factor (ECF subfamily)